MKQPKSLKLEYKLAVEAYGLNPEKYMLLKVAMCISRSFTRRVGKRGL